uniref:Uncharacterized protein n=1 Tax=Globodera rostochiensis TaxID=31243 RepID=A0A914GTU1_GLORO
MPKRINPSNSREEIDSSRRSRMWKMPRAVAIERAVLIRVYLYADGDEEMSICRKPNDMRRRRAQGISAMVVQTPLQGLITLFILRSSTLMSAGKELLKAILSSVIKYVETRGDAVKAGRLGEEEAEVAWKLSDAERIGWKRVIDAGSLGRDVLLRGETVAQIAEERSRIRTLCARFENVHFLWIPPPYVREQHLQYIELLPALERGGSRRLRRADAA